MCEDEYMSVCSLVIYLPSEEHISSEYAKAVLGNEGLFGKDSYYTYCCQCSVSQETNYGNRHCTGQISNMLLYFVFTNKLDYILFY